MIVDKIIAYVAAVGIAILAAALAAQTMRLSAAKTELAAVKHTLSEERRLAAEAGKAAVEQFRVAELRNSNIILNEVRDAHLASDRTRAAGVRAAAAGDGLRLRTTALAARCGQAPEAPGAAAGGPTAQEAGLLLADVSRRLDEAGRQLADLAERSLIAGQTCERIYTLTGEEQP